jgi:hypothetical protein
LFCQASHECRVRAKREPAGEVRLVFDARTGIAKADKGPDGPDVSVDQPQNAADTLKLLNASAASAAVAKRVSRAERFAGLGFGTGGLPPRGPAADQLGLPRSSFGAPPCPRAA